MQHQPGASCQRSEAKWLRHRMVLRTAHLPTSRALPRARAVNVEESVAPSTD
jgi:hypothetical protein